MEEIKYQLNEDGTTIVSYSTTNCDVEMMTKLANNGYQYNYNVLHIIHCDRWDVDVLRDHYKMLTDSDPFLLEKGINPPENDLSLYKNELTVHRFEDYNPTLNQINDWMKIVKEKHNLIYDIVFVESLTEENE